LFFFFFFFFHLARAVHDVPDKASGIHTLLLLASAPI
jgi:hypothetical protein